MRNTIPTSIPRPLFRERKRRTFLPRLWCLLKATALVILALALISYRKILKEATSDAAIQKEMPSGGLNKLSTLNTNASSRKGRRPSPSTELIRPQRLSLLSSRFDTTSTKTHPKENNENSSVIDCGCPESCTGVALDRTINGNPYSCLERIEFLMNGGRAMDQHNACLFASSETDAACTSACNPTNCIPEEKYTAKNVMIIASVPRDEKHAVALWSELECLTKGVDLIVLSVPEWSRNLVEQIVEQATTELNLNNIQVHYHVNNNRHDVGLWCGALNEKVELIENGTVVLLNDSVYALRQFTNVSDVMRGNVTLDLVGLSYSNTGGSFWIESVLRGFSSRGMATFKKHSCDSSRSTFCRQKPRVERKRCIVEHHEIALAGLYPRDNVLGLYPSDPPANWPDKKTWVQNPKYWRDVLVDQMDFPVAKVNQPNMIPDTTNELLQACTKHMGVDFLRSFDYSQFENIVLNTVRAHDGRGQRKETPNARLIFRQPQ